MKNISLKVLTKKSAQSGFTLIELLIVLGIVVIMTAVTLGSLTRSQDQQIFNNSFEKLYSLINTARSLSISGKGQLDYTDFDNDGCKDTGAPPPGATCSVPDYVTPANYGVQFNEHTAPNVILFADINPPTSGATGQKGVYNSGSSYATGDDLDLDSLTLPTGITLEIRVDTGSEINGTIFFSPNYADITFDSNMNGHIKPYLLLRLKQGANICKQIRIHKLAGIPEVESCTVPY
jgi:prepilin-type N-terminal cleavage/methylation domain-containing protein